MLINVKFPIVSLNFGLLCDTMVQLGLVGVTKGSNPHQLCCIHKQQKNAPEISHKDMKLFAEFASHTS